MLQRQILEVLILHGLWADNIGQNTAKRGVCPQVLILK
jgi:hypothetical protein